MVHEKKAIVKDKLKKMVFFERLRALEDIFYREYGIPIEITLEDVIDALLRLRMSEFKQLLEPVIQEKLKTL